MGPTKTIRVPAALSDQVMAFARALDQGTVAGTSFEEVLELRRERSELIASLESFLAAQKGNRGNVSPFRKQIQAILAALLSHETGNTVA